MKKYIYRIRKYEIFSFLDLDKTFEGHNTFCFKVDFTNAFFVI